MRRRLRRLRQLRWILHGLLRRIVRRLWQPAFPRTRFLGTIGRRRLFERLGRLRLRRWMRAFELQLRTCLRPILAIHGWWSMRSGWMRGWIVRTMRCLFRPGSWRSDGPNRTVLRHAISGIPGALFRAGLRRHYPPDLPADDAAPFAAALSGNLFVPSRSGSKSYDRALA